VVLNLLSAIKAIPPSEPAAPVIVEFLTQLSDADWWPDDEVFEQNWCSRKFYGGLRRERVLMILQAIEEQYHRAGSKSEPIVSFDFRLFKLSTFSPKIGKSIGRFKKSDPHAISRNQRLHSIGNLTLSATN